MTNTQKIILGVLGLIASCLMVVVGFLAMDAYRSTWTQPLGPALSFPSYTPGLASNLPTGTPFQPQPVSVVFTATPTLTLPTPVPGVPPSGESSPTPLPTVPLEAPAFAACGGPPLMTLLVVGSDARSDSYNYGLGDLIRVVRADFVARRVTVLEFPRDLWVQIPDIADNINGQDHEKLNQAYLYGNPGFGYTDDPAQGPGLLARTLDINFGVRPDHYVAVNMRTFENVVNAVGGIDINLPYTIDGRTAEDTRRSLLFVEGPHHLNGQQALQLARIRIDGVFERTDAQNLVLCALRDKLTSPSVVGDIPELIASFQDNVQTDLSPEQLSQLACLGTQLPPENIAFAAFPSELFTQSRVYDPVFKGRVFVWDVDFNVLREYVRQFNAGTWPTPAPPGDASDEDQPISVCP